MGSLADDTISAANTSDLNALRPTWVSDASISLATIFDGNNFIDGGKGVMPLLLVLVMISSILVHGQKIKEKS